MLWDAKVVGVDRQRTLEICHVTSDARIWVTMCEPALSARIRFWARIPILLWSDFSGGDGAAKLAEQILYIHGDNRLAHSSFRLRVWWLELYWFVPPQFLGDASVKLGHPKAGGPRRDLANTPRGWGAHIRVSWRAPSASLQGPPTNVLPNMDWQIRKTTHAISAGPHIPPSGPTLHGLRSAGAAEYSAVLRSGGSRCGAPAVSPEGSFLFLRWGLRPCH